MRIPLRKLVAALAAVLATAVAAGAAPTAGADRDTANAGASAAGQPNIVFVLTDDMSMDLLRYMTEVDALRQQGTTMENFFYGDSLCCPSRATILSGKFPHNTGVLTNTSKFGDGGMGAFLDDEDTALGVRLQEAGYRTGLMGKYLNEYQPDGSWPELPYDYPPLYVPPGWDEWHAPGRGGYNEMVYNLTRSVDGDTTLQKFDGRYLTDVLSNKANHFLDRAVEQHPGQPFFLEIATFAPHSKVKRDPVLPFVPAPRDRADPETGFAGDCGPADCRTVRAPRDGSFDAPMVDGPAWLRDAPLTTDEIAAIDHKYVLRVQMLQAVNDLIRSLRAKLSALGVADNTYLVFGSDNGFHLGEHRLLVGKGTPYDHDARMPLVVVGPGVPAGQERSELVQNTDLFATFLRIAGSDPGKQDGHSMLGLWHGGTAWPRDVAYLEHTTHGTTAAGDPDAADEPANAQPGSYRAIRTSHEVYVEYATGEVEYHDLTTDPAELHNTVAALPAARRALLHNTLTALATCGRPGKPSCWSASSF